MAVISGLRTSVSLPFTIESLTIPDLNTFTTLNYSASPTTYGLSASSKLVTGDIAQSTEVVRLRYLLVGRLSTLHILHLRRDLFINKRLCYRNIRYQIDSHLR